MAYGNPARLYVLETEDGYIKAGITSLPAEKRFALYACKEQITRHFITTQYVTGFKAEADLLARLGRIGTIVRGREWFSGVRFAQVVQLTEQVARKHVNRNPVSKAHLLRKPFAAIHFSKREMAVLDAYCAKVGKRRSAACRDLLLQVATLRADRAPLLADTPNLRKGA